MLPLKIRNFLAKILSRLDSLQFRDTYPEIGTCDVLLCCNDVNRGETLQGQVYSKLIDSVNEDLNKRGWICAQFSHPYASLIGNKAWGNPVSANRRFFMGELRLRLFKLGARLGIRFNPKVEASIKYYRERFFDELLQSTQCKCVINIGDTDHLFNAAHRANIPVIELLHGIGYGSVPWGWDRKDADRLPNGILSLDDVSTKTFSQLSTKGVTVKQIAHPWLKRFRDPILSAQLPKEWTQPPTWLPTDRRIVMLSFQWGYAGEYKKYHGIIPNGFIHDALLHAIELTKDTVFWLLRLHPMQLRRKHYYYQHVFLDDFSKTHYNCEWKQSSTLPLPLLLRQCHAHITMSSMTAYEAAFLAVPSLLLCPTLKPGGANQNQFKDLRGSGYAELGELSAQQIKEWTEQAVQLPQAFQTSSAQSWDTVIEWMLESSHKGPHQA